MIMIKSSLPQDLTPKHVRAARALLAWSQQDLAKNAGVATSTIADFERGHRTPVANNAHAIRGALETAGVRFLPTGAVIGPPIPTMDISDRPGIPVRWVSAQDLSDWADRNDGVAGLPTLIANLIRATHGSAHLRFPSDEGIRHSGWDGQTIVEEGSIYVPQGVAGWEIGAQRKNVSHKASEDYAKRTKDASPIESAHATYIFVTPRHWPGKDAWANERKKQGVWRDVRVYDVNDLVHWIEQNPAVGAWLASRLNKRPAGTRELEDVWNEWSLATEPPLSADLVLSDRDEDVASVLQWLRSPPSVMSIRATTVDEAVAFFHAALAELPDEFGQTYRARCLIVTSEEAGRQFVNAPTSLILLMTEPNPGLSRVLAGKGHFVLQIYDEQVTGDGDVRTLARPSREGIATALMMAGLAEQRAEALARDSGRELAVLRRRLPGAPGRLPAWAASKPSRSLLAALLIGGWHEERDGDRQIIEELSDNSYETTISELAPMVRDLDSPLQKVGSAWRVTSPIDAWFLLAQNFSADDIARYEKAALKVLGAADPRFEMEPDDRWMAAVRGVKPQYSGLLRHGVGRSMILMALWGDKIRTVPDVRRRVDHIVRTLLDGADGKRWWSLSGDFRLLAEASPGAFLDAIEESLDRNDPPIEALFGSDGGGITGQEHLADLMWALESLAWSREHMPRITHVLARLDAIDQKPRRFTNGPANSLRNIHLLWHPETFSALDDRLKALDFIRKHEPDTAWKLMIGILPQGRDHMSPSAVPRWRDYTIDDEEVVTWGLVERGTTEISKRLLEDADLSPQRWSDLLDCLTDLVPDAKPALVKLTAAEARMTDDEARATLWRQLRSTLHKHREFPDADWSLDEPVLTELEKIYHKFAPADPIDRLVWLFDHNAELPDRASAGWETEQRDIDEARKQAATSLYQDGGIAAIGKLARQARAPSYIGKALYDAGLPTPEFDKLLEFFLKASEFPERDVAHGIVVSASRGLDREWSTRLIERALAEKWGNEALLTLLRALPIERWVWERVSAIGGDIETTYWRTAGVTWVDGREDDIVYAIGMLLKVGMARRAVGLAGRMRKADLPSDLVLEVLRDAAKQPLSPGGEHNDLAMFRYHVAELMEILDKRGDVERDALATLEWTYLEILEHSRRPAKALLAELSEQPKLFVDLLKAVYRKSDDDTDTDDAVPKDPEIAHAVASRAYSLLGSWNRIPGTKDDQSIDPVILTEWIKEARKLAREAGRLEIGDSRIGHMLSSSPDGADGSWPTEAVREVIDLFHSKEMIDGFVIGKMNRRGVTTRMPRDGGILERQEEARYRSSAEAIRFDHPRTANALIRLADYYERDARREDEQAEQMDWHS